MLKCSKECYPCCDYCIYAIYVTADLEDVEIKLTPQGCSKHPEEHYQSMARSCGYCKDFHCINAEKKKKESTI